MQPENVALGPRLSQSKPLYQAYKALRWVYIVFYGVVEGGWVRGGGHLHFRVAYSSRTWVLEGVEEANHCTRHTRLSGE